MPLATGMRLNKILLSRNCCNLPTKLLPDATHLRYAVLKPYNKQQYPFKEIEAAAQQVEYMQAYKGTAVAILNRQQWLAASTAADLAKPS